MNKENAVFLLRSLIERLDRNQLGTISTDEREALVLALAAFGGAPNNLNAAFPAPAAVSQSESGLLKTNGAAPAMGDPDRGASTTLPPLTAPVQINLRSLDQAQPDSEELLLCLDFGTAMSKAFARIDDESFSLALGVEAGGEGFPVPSSIFIDDGGRMYFGFEALQQSERAAAHRLRYDSFKGTLSMRSQGDLDSEAHRLPAEANPIASVRLTEGDLLRIYLAYLTDLALSRLESREKARGGEVGRYVRRRFAHPCWSKQDQKQWAEPLMATLMAEAQVLADTFHGKWTGGLDIREVESAVKQVRALAKRPDYVIAGGIPEPVAVAAGALSEDSNHREPFLVVDVGAGTTDFGLFVIRENPEIDLHKVFQVSETVMMVKQAGDKVDSHLLFFIADAWKIDKADTHGRVILADLRRQIRQLKERLMDTGVLEHVLADSTPVRVTRDEFLASPQMVLFRDTVAKALVESLSLADDTYLQWVARQGLKVVLTGGGARLKTIQELTSGSIKVRGYEIKLERIDPTPEWLGETAPDLVPIYPQMAVAVGGAAPELPEVTFGPAKFGGGAGPTAYSAERFPISGT